jgi:isopenicillin-N N-acyltransferase-like protein
LIKLMNTTVIRKTELKNSNASNFKRHQGQTIKQIDLAGDHFVMGQQHGHQVRRLRPHILAAIDERLLTLSEIQLDIQPIIEEICATWEMKARPTMDMLRGIADTLWLDWEKYYRYTIAPYVLDRIQYSNNHSQGCTTLAAAAPVTRDNTPLLAKNRDYRPNHHQLQCLVWSHPAQGYRHAYLTSAGSPGIFSSGMNEAGLAVADTYVSSRDIGPGLPRYAVMMELLEHHNHVESALDYLQSVQHTGNGTLTLLDSRGDMAVYEAGYSRFGVVRSNEGFVVSTNHFETPQKRNHWIRRGSTENPSNSHGRYSRVRKALQSAKGETDIAWAMKLMTTHEGSYNSICRHPDTDSNHSTTISSVLYLPQEKQIYLANGIPCQTDFQKWSLN